MELLGSVRVVPGVEIPNADAAVELAQTLSKAGLPCAEVTFRTESAAAAITAISRAVPGFAVGAGTILSVEQARVALDAGATFLVSPGLNDEVIDFAQVNSIPIVPGAATPTEVGHALSLGLNLLKFFPAEALGGVGYLKALNGPFKQVSFMPTGGITEQNLGAYLELPNVVACGGSWMARRNTLLARDFAEIERIATRAVALAQASTQAVEAARVAARA